MEVRDTLYIINFTAPAVTAFICLGMILMRYGERSRYTTDTKLMKLLLGYYVTILCVSLTSFSFIYLRAIYAYVNFISTAAILYSIVIIYQIIHSLTSTSSGKVFSFIHYLTPVMIALIQLFWSFYYLSITDSEALYTDQWFLMVSSFKLGVWIVYGTIYSLSGLRKVIRYKKIIADYSADEDRSSLRWLYVVIILTIALIPLTFLYVFFRNEQVLYSIFSLLVNFILQLQLVVLAYNVFIENYILMYPVGNYAEKRDSVPNIDKERFESLIKNEKPYLNPGLKITDLTRVMCTNRSYLSGFINKTYGMSFSRYINNCRLTELRCLENNSKGSGYEKETLIIKAGFRSIRGYHQFIAQEKKKHGKA